MPTKKKKSNVLTTVFGLIASIGMIVAGSPAVVGQKTADISKLVSAAGLAGLGVVAADKKKDDSE